MTGEKDIIEVKDGYKVTHKIYGEGVVVAFDERYVHIQFKDRKRTFVFPSCFPKYLDTKDKMFQDIIIKAKRVAAANEDKRLKREQIYAILNPKMNTSNPRNNKLKDTKNGPVRTTYINVEQKKKSILIEERKAKQEKEKTDAIKFRQTVEAQTRVAAVKERERLEEEHHAQVNAERRRREQERLYQSKEEERRRWGKEIEEANKQVQLNEKIEQQKKIEENLHDRLEIQRKEQEETERQARMPSASEGTRRKVVAQMRPVCQEMTQLLNGENSTSSVEIKPLTNEQIIVAEERHPIFSKRIIHVAIVTAACLGMVFGAHYAYYSPEANYTMQMWKHGTIATEEGVYQGDFSWGIINGDGEFTFTSGDTYTGSWIDNKFDGTGILTLVNGDIIEGQFDDGQLISGVYTREFDEGILTKIIENGRPNDIIKVEFNDGTTLYTDIQDGEINDGTVIYPNGDEYVGGLKNGLRHGQGKYSWNESEEIYAGGWENGVISGKGVYTINSKETLNGTFLDGKFYDGMYTVDYAGTGSGNIKEVVYYIENGLFVDKIAVKSTTATYTGTYNTNSGALTGTGIVVYKNGDNYRGPVTNGVKVGSGIYRWADGDIFDGAWSGDTMNGWGTYYFGSGGTKRLVGNFKNGKPNGTLTYYDISGTRYITYWNNGTHTGSAYG